MPARHRHREGPISRKAARREAEQQARADRWAARQAFSATPEGIWAEREAQQRAEYGPWDD